MGAWENNLGQNRPLGKVRFFVARFCTYPHPGGCEISHPPGWVYVPLHQVIRIPHHWYWIMHKSIRISHNWCWKNHGIEHISTTTPLLSCCRHNLIIWRGRWRMILDSRLRLSRNCRISFKNIQLLLQLVAECTHRKLSRRNIPVYLESCHYDFIYFLLIGAYDWYGWGYSLTPWLWFHFAAVGNGNRDCGHLAARHRRQQPTTCQCCSNPNRRHSPNQMHTCVSLQYAFSSIRARFECHSWKCDQSE